jgi:hypothetical protein
MKLFFNIDVHPFYSEIRFAVTNGEDKLVHTDKYTNGIEDYGSFIFDGKQYDWIIYHSYGQDHQDLVNIYECDVNDNFKTDYTKPLKNKWVRIFI